MAAPIPDVARTATTLHIRCPGATGASALAVNGYRYRQTLRGAVQDFSATGRSRSADLTVERLLKRGQDYRIGAELRIGQRHARSYTLTVICRRSAAFLTPRAVPGMPGAPTSSLTESHNVSGNLPLQSAVMQTELTAADFDDLFTGPVTLMASAPLRRELSLLRAILPPSAPEDWPPRPLFLDDVVIVDSDSVAATARSAR